jgi:KipI family sensor histidine kinase inhibitor
MTFQPKIVPVGDSAVLVQLGEDIDLRVNRRIHALAALLHASPLDGVIETVPAYATLLVHYDPLNRSYVEVRDWVRGKLDQTQESDPQTPRRIDVPVLYGSEYGPDLDVIARLHDLRVEEVIRIHSARIYTVYMMGFTPGFPYMGKLDDALITPRLETPRTRVPAGTVAIAGSQTGIYPVDSPGGWRLIGRTPLRLFDPRANPPFLFAPGDEVRFVPERA